METERHFVNRSRWLRAAVLGVNDGILSTTSLVIGVAAVSLQEVQLFLQHWQALLGFLIPTSWKNYIA